MRRSGTTLVELIVTIAVLGVMAAVATLALRRMSPAANTLTSALQNARQLAAERGSPVAGSRVEHDNQIEFVAYPDGRVVIDTGFSVNPLTGIVPKARP